MKDLNGFEGMKGITFDQVKAKAENDQRYRLKESDFKGMPGYERYYVDDMGVEHEGEHPADGSYQWRWRPGRGDAVAEAIMAWAIREVARIADQNGYPGSYGIKGRRTVVGPRAQEQGSSQGSAGRAARHRRGR